jgi:hypothetical protein
MLGGGYGDPKKTCRSIYRHEYREGVVKTPYGAPEHRKALGERPEGRRRVRHPGSLFFGGFLLAEQKKATQGAGAEPPAIRF